MTPEIGLLLKFLDVQAVRPAVKLPVHITDRLALVILAMFGKLHREPVERTLVQTCNKALHHL